MLQEICKKTSGFLAAFFFSISALAAPVGNESNEKNISALIAKAKEKQLANNPVWAALLHASGKDNFIKDKGFTLSGNEFSLERELQLTIEYLFSKNTESVCRFPARYFWIKQELSTPALPIENCEFVSEFRAKAPIDRVSLIFASETLAQPSSMMGHIFLKIDGVNKSGDKKSHAISFYTDADTWNIPKLFFESIVVGKKGFFSLTPFDQQKTHYIDVEQRAIWEYELNLSSHQIEILRLHLLELRQTELSYFFQKYNCATVVDFILALSGKTIPNQNFWATPKDVIKNANHGGLIKSTLVELPARALTKILSSNIGSQKAALLSEAVQKGVELPLNKESNQDDNFIDAQFAIYYNKYSNEKSEINTDTYQENLKKINQYVSQNFPDHSLSFTGKYNPLDTPQDSQVSIFYGKSKAGGFVAVDLLPASHEIASDNRNYLDETSLNLFTTRFKLPLNGTTPKIDQFTIYGIKSITPYESLTGGLSGRFRIGFEQQKDFRLDNHLGGVIDGGIGLATRPHKDIDIYALFGGGLGYAGQKSYIYSNPEAGFIMREIFDLKTVASVSHTSNQFNSPNYITVKIEQVKYLNKNNTVSIRWQTEMAKNKVSEHLEAGWKYLF